MAHKLQLLSKVAEYVQQADRAFLRPPAGSSRVTYVVPPDNIAPTLARARDGSVHGGGGGGEGSSSCHSLQRHSHRDLHVLQHDDEHAYMRQQQVQSPMSAAVLPTSGEWALTDFIKANILDKHLDQARALPAHGGGGGHAKVPKAGGGHSRVGSGIVEGARSAEVRTGRAKCSSTQQRHEQRFEMEEERPQPHLARSSSGSGSGSGRSVGLGTAVSNRRNNSAILSTSGGADGDGGFGSGAAHPQSAQLNSTFSSVDSAVSEGSGGVLLGASILAQTQPPAPQPSPPRSPVPAPASPSKATYPQTAGGTGTRAVLSARRSPSPDPSPRKHHPASGKHPHTAISQPSSSSERGEGQGQRKKELSEKDRRVDKETAELRREREREKAEERTEVLREVDWRCDRAVRAALEKDLQLVSLLTRPPPPPHHHHHHHHHTHTHYYYSNR